MHGHKALPLMLPPVLETAASTRLLNGETYVNFQAAWSSQAQALSSALCESLWWLQGTPYLLEHACICLHKCCGLWMTYNCGRTIRMALDKTPSQ